MSGLLGLLWLAGPVADAAPVVTPGPARGDRPNILWLTCEDAGPHLGCYGDPVATTPEIDRLAARGLRFRRVWSVAPVCAPARTALITGRYPSSLGAGHMRSLVPLPSGAGLLPAWLRAAGYYTSNNRKEDYNVVRPADAWDDSSGKAHWRDRPPGRPFFAVFNYTESHESQIRRPGAKTVHDPRAVRIPGYMPDTPEVRDGWAQYHDRLTEVDGRVGAALRELEAAGLAGDTIVFFFGDHGSGMPRSKRSACDSGLRVPLVVHVPERWRHLAPEGYRPGGESDRLVSFVDLAPTVLSLAGVEAPVALPGVAFAGVKRGPGPRHLFGQRGRMDERQDLVRSVTDGRYVYLRNYLPHLPHGQRNAYMFQTPATAAWHRLHALGAAGGLSAVQRAFWEPRESEELYDLESDPDETRNLAGLRSHASVLSRLRRAHLRHERGLSDVELMPEAEMLRRAVRAGVPPGALGRLDRDAGGVDLRRVLAVAERAAARDDGSVRWLIRCGDDPEPAVRWWAATGLGIRGAGAVREGSAVLARMLRADPSPTVRIAAADAWLRWGGADEVREAVDFLVGAADARRSDYFDAVAALQSIDGAPEQFRDRDRRAALEALPRTLPGVEPRVQEHLDRLLDSILRRAGEGDGRTRP